MPRNLMDSVWCPWLWKDGRDALAVNLLNFLRPPKWPTPGIEETRNEIS